MPVRNNDEADSPTTVGEVASGRPPLHMARNPRTTARNPCQQPSQRDQPPHTTSKVHLVKKGALNKDPPEAVPTEFVEWEVEAVIKQPDLPTSGPKKRRRGKD